MSPLNKNRARDRSRLFNNERFSRGRSIGQLNRLKTPTRAERWVWVDKISKVILGSRSFSNSRMARLVFFLFPTSGSKFMTWFLIWLSSFLTAIIYYEKNYQLIETRVWLQQEEIICLQHYLKCREHWFEDLRHIITACKYKNKR